MQEMNITDEPAQVTQSMQQRQDIRRPKPTAPVTQSTPERKEIIRPKPAPIDMPNDSSSSASSIGQRLRNTKKKCILYEGWSPRSIRPM